MPTWLAVILEIVKITVPALIVFLTIYFLLKEFLQKQLQIQSLEFKQRQQGVTLPIRLQAYERLSLLIERISIPNLLFRLRAQNSTAGALRVALLLAIQQEFEHNVTQRVYVSDKLWSILRAARQDTETIINGIAEKVDPKAPAEELAGTLLNYLDMQETTATETAQLAIKTEAGLYL
ncbi:MAG: hypothetical protein H6563_09245 [Lewinellaceae bacterium]|nr:hypothetical protein [Lewinellaceae bacterium]